MTGSPRLFLIAVLCLCAAPFVSARAIAETEVDVALVIAVDISYSMDPEEQELQREGFAEALRSPLVHDAIRKGMTGRIAVAYMEWAGESDQRVLLPWTLLDNAESILAFADRIASARPSRELSMRQRSCSRTMAWRRPVR